jgi:hypothetical protein
VLGNEDEHVFCSASFLIRVTCPRPILAEQSLVSFATVTIALEFLLASPTSPGFYPHSEWAALGPVQFGVRFQARVHHRGDEPGLLGCCYL